MDVWTEMDKPKWTASNGQLQMDSCKWTASNGHVVIITLKILLLSGTMTTCPFGIVHLQLSIWGCPFAAVHFRRFDPWSIQSISVHTVHPLNYCVSITTSSFIGTAVRRGPVGTGARSENLLSVLPAYEDIINEPLRRQILFS
jgi:hypothetical protein